MRASGACTAALGVPGELIPPAPRSRFEAVDSYGVIRRCRTGFKVGPLFSETEEEADVLFLDTRLGKRADECQTRDNARPGHTGTLSTCTDTRPAQLVRKTFASVHSLDSRPTSLPILDASVSPVYFQTLSH